jgi:hypothetical protein
MFYVTFSFFKALVVRRATLALVNSNFKETVLKLLFSRLAIPLTILCFVPVSANAAPSYDFVQLAYQNTEYADIRGFSLRGFATRLSTTISPSIFIEANYINSQDQHDDITFKNPKWKLSLGYIQTLNTHTSLDYQVGYGNLEIDLSNTFVRQKEDANIMAYEFNIRHMLNDAWEIYGGLEFQNWDIGSNQKAYHLGTLYDAPIAKVGMEYTKFSDSEIIGLTLRYDF